MARPSVNLTPEALRAAARLREHGCGYREIARELLRHRLVPRPINPGTVWRRLFEAGVVRRERRRPVRKEVR